MFITKKHLSRRTVPAWYRRSVALPFLDAMVPAATAARPDRGATRSRASSAASCRTAHGAGLLGAGDGTATARRLAAVQLQAARAVPRPDRSSLSGLHSRSAEPPPGVTGADHCGRGGVLVRQQAERKTAGADIEAGTTIDQMIAQQDRPGDAAAVAAVVRSRIPARTPAIAARVTAAPTPTRSRGRRRRSRCRWSSIRRWCSSACSATAARPKSARAPQARPQHSRTR